MSADQIVEVSAEERPCFDPECEGIAEPEMDAEHRYWECVECGYCFGYEKVEGTRIEACQIGVPEGVRRAYSEQHEEATRRVVGANAAKMQLPVLPSNPGNR